MFNRHVFSFLPNELLVFGLTYASDFRSRRGTASSAELLMLGEDFLSPKNLIRKAGTQEPRNKTCGVRALTILNNNSSGIRPVDVWVYSSCARAFIGYVRKLPHPFTCLVRRIHSGGTNQMAFSCDLCSNLVK
jgi:hypothetical protein